MFGVACVEPVDLERVDLDGPSDPDATAETSALFHNLRAISDEATMFGHQDDLAYGVDWFGEPGRSDVFETAGSYPAVTGWDLGGIEHGNRQSLDRIEFDDMRALMITSFERGAVQTASWHLDNLATGGDSWDYRGELHELLPDGDHHELFVAALDRLAEFVTSIVTVDGVPVPIVFRPFHEMNGDWFFWGARDRDDFIDLWRFTVTYLRQTRDVHQLLYCYAPDRFDSTAELARYYPGDEWVDVIGFDDYDSVARPVSLGRFARRLRRTVEFADAGGKIAALTETGEEGVPDPDWWTDVLLEGLRRDPVGARVAWALVWRNANASIGPEGHFFAPHADHPSAPNFAVFRAAPDIWFEDELPDLYLLNAR